MFAQHLGVMAALLGGLLGIPSALCQPAGRSTPPTSKPATLSVQSILEKAERNFIQGDYDSAAAQLDLLDETNLGKENRSRLFLLRARLEFAYGRESTMRLWLEKLFINDPEAKLDPLLDPPSAFLAMREFQEERKRNDEARLRTSETEKRTGEQRPTTPQGPLFETEAKLKEEARFWVGLVPLGIGHFDANRYQDGFLYLGSELLVLVATSEVGRKEAIASRENIRYGGESDDRTDYNSVLLGTFGFLGLWGHEVRSVSPELHARDPESAKWVRYGLSFIPFGVGQLKNNEPAKAIGVAGAQIALLGASVLAPKFHQRSLATNLFVASLLYGAYDGWVNHRWEYEAAVPSNAHVRGTQNHVDLKVMPTLVQSRLGISAHLNLKF